MTRGSDMEIASASLLEEIARKLQHRLAEAEAAAVLASYRQLSAQLEPIETMDLGDAQPALGFDPLAPWRSG